MPRRAAFCKSSILVVTPIASRCLERLGVTAPSAPTTIGTTFALTFQSRMTGYYYYYNYYYYYYYYGTYLCEGLLMLLPGSSAHKKSRSLFKVLLRNNILQA